MTGYATANDKPLLKCVLHEPRVGAWSAEIDADDADALSGLVTLVIGEQHWVGTVTRGDQAYGRSHARIVGGAGKLEQLLDARYYVGTTFGTVLDDVMRATGETLALDTADWVKRMQVDRWTRSYASAGQALTQVATEAGITWRTQRAGPVWLGGEDWPSATADVFTIIDRAPAEGEVTIALEEPTLTPGTIFLAKPISLVTTVLTPEGLRQHVLFEDVTQGEPFGRGLGDLAAIVESLTGSRFDYSRFYPATVVKQAADGTLELLADAKKVRGNGITQVPIRHGLPGVSVKVNPEARVLLFFENGDPRKPAAALWPDGSSCEEISIKAPTVKIDGDLVVTGDVVAGQGTGGAVSLLSHQHPSAMGATSKPIPMVTNDAGQALSAANNFGAVTQDTDGGDLNGPTLRLDARPHVANPDGSGSLVTVLPIIYRDAKGYYVVIPTIALDGTIMSAEDAITYADETGMHLGKYTSQEDAKAAAEAIDRDQAQRPPRNTLAGSADNGTCDGRTVGPPASMSGPTLYTLASDTAIAATPYTVTTTRAAYYRADRRSDPRFIVLHLADVAETAAQSASYLADLGTGVRAERPRSVNFIVSGQLADAPTGYAVNESVESVAEAFHAGYTANRYGLGVALVGAPETTSAQWLTDNTPAKRALDAAAQLLAQLCHDFSLPAEYASSEDLLLGKAGITTHYEVSRAYPSEQGTLSGTLCWDPGPGFPLAELILAAKRKLASMPAPAIDAKDPPWMKVARAEAGVAEMPGAAANSRILDYFKATSLQTEDDSTHWCSAFANFCMQEAKVSRTNAANARSWLNWGQPLESPRPGCIVVLSAPSRGAASGHVGFYVSEDAKHIRLYGGNQANRVGEASYGKDSRDVLGYRWPTQADLAALKLEPAQGPVNATPTSYRLECQLRGKTTRYVLTQDDVDTLMRAVNFEGAPQAAVCWTLLQRFCFVYPIYTSLATFVQAYAQPINPLWFPSGKRHIAELERLTRRGLREEYTAEERNAAKRRDMASLPLEQLQSRNRAIVQDVLSGQTPSPAPQAVHYRAPTVRTQDAATAAQARAEFAANNNMVDNCKSLGDARKDNWFFGESGSDKLTVRCSGQ